MKFLRTFDWLAFLTTLALVAIGTTAIRSAGGARAEAVFHGMWISNLTTAGFGLVLYFLLAFLDYRKLLLLTAVPAYVVSLLLLVAVLLFGAEQFGGRRWLWFFQPSEVSKLAILLLLATLFGEGRRSGFAGFVLAGALVGAPILLILAEPDLGTALTLLPAVLVMLLCAGVWRRGLLVLVAVGGILTLAVLGAVYEAERPGVSPERRARIMRCVPLKDHQVRRVKVFLFPEEDLPLVECPMTLSSSSCISSILLIMFDLH